VPFAAWGAVETPKNQDQGRIRFCYPRCLVHRMESCEALFLQAEGELREIRRIVDAMDLASAAGRAAVRSSPGNAIPRLIRLQAHLASIQEHMDQADLSPSDLRAYCSKLGRMVDETGPLVVRVSVHARAESERSGR
jgi:hypothetical protein